MYSGEKNPGINWKDLIVKIIFFVIFVLILMWLFPKVPNMTAFYSNVFRENISYMQDAAKSYYTNERLPKNIGDTSEMTLQDMIDKNLIIPFVDKDGNPCDTNESYVQVTKESDEEYSLKVNLVCDTEKSYIIEILGCYDYCKDNKCDDVIAEETTRQNQYQFKQAYTVDQSSSKCTDSTYNKLINGLCYSTVKAESTSEVKDKLLDVIISNASVKVPYNCDETDSSNVCTTKYKTETQTQSYTCTKYKTKTQTQNYTCTKYKTETQTQSYTCTKYKTEEKCTTTYKQQPYSCNCTTKFVNGKYTTSCNTCYKSVPKKTCSNVSVPYSSTCTKEVSVRVPYSSTCTKEASVRVPYSSTCTKEVSVQVPYQDCEVLTTTIPKICYKTETKTNYSCPEGTITQIGSGADLKCYTSEKIEINNVCKSGYTYNSQYGLCISNSGKKPTVSTAKVTKYKYTWSSSESLEGWERTGNTRIVEI